MAFTRIWEGPSSLASDFVKPMGTYALTEQVHLLESYHLPLTDNTCFRSTVYALTYIALQANNTGNVDDTSTFYRSNISDDNKSSCVCSHTSVFYHGFADQLTHSHCSKEIDIHCIL